MRKILSLILGLLWVLPSWGALPSGYTELEYIESTGTQYIDTGFSPDANTRVDYKGQLLQYTSSVPLLGARLGTDNIARFLPLAWSTGVDTGRTVYGAKDAVLNISTSTIYTGTFIPAQGKTIINGVTYDISGANFTKIADNNFYLFATSGYAGNLYNSVGRIWYVKIWDNNTLVRDLVPAKNSSGVIGMYDTVNNRFYENASTGEFVAGPVMGIKIATTKYNETKFSPLNTALANAISVVDTVVSNTITQAGRIATLQAQKQTRPDETCPAGKKCLLVEDASGTPHWYEIVTGRLPDGYTELEYIESTGTQYIDTNVLVTDDISWEGRFLSKNDTSKAASIFGYRWTETPTAQGNMRFVFIYPDGTFAVRFGVDASRTNLILSGAETVTLKCEKDKFYANGSLFYTETRKNNEGEPQSGYLFNVNALNTVDITPVKMKLYYFKMWDDGTLVRDFVPALNPDGKIGMYDTVNGVFYENKGTGTFIGGQPVFN